VVTFFYIVKCHKIKNIFVGRKSVLNLGFKHKESLQNKVPEKGLSW